MQKKLLAGWGMACILLFFLISHAAPNTAGIESVIYRIELGGESVGCLVGTFHLTPKRPAESKALIECSKDAPIAAFESLKEFTLLEQLQIYERKDSDFMFTSLSHSTQERAISALTKIGWPEKDINILKQMHPGAVLHVLTSAKPISLDFTAFEIGEDLLHMLYRQKNALPLFELEGNDSALIHVREISLSALDSSIENISIILNDEELSRKARDEIINALKLFPSMPDPQAGMNLSIKINSEILKLSPEYTDRFIYWRNQRLADGMERAIKLHGRALIFVGLAHLGEPEGIPGLLEKKGYKLIRIQ